jgi:antitoxin ParD1/3/4
MPILTVQITEELDAFISGSIMSGHYKDSEDIIQAALELLVEEEDDHDYKLSELKKAIQEGVDSGIAEGGTEEVFARVRQRAGLPVRTRA